MFRLSRKAEYALRAVLHLSMKNSICTTEEIAVAQDIPMPFLKKIIPTLRVAGFIISVKGQKGGIILKKNPEEITVREVIENVEGPIFLNDCLMRKGLCPRDCSCPLHEMWHECQDSIMKILENRRFSELVERHLELLSKLKKAGESETSSIRVAKPSTMIG